MASRRSWVRIPSAPPNARKFRRTLGYFCAARACILMPYFFDFDSTNRILRCRLEGPVTDEELKDFYRRAAEYVSRTSPRAGVMDLSAVTAFDVSPETVRELAQSSPVMPNQELPRFVIAASPKVFGLARMFELEGQSTRPNLHVVQSMEAACVILRLEKLNFEPIEVN